MPVSTTGYGSEALARDSETYSPGFAPQYASRIFDRIGQRQQSAGVGFIAPRRRPDANAFSPFIPEGFDPSSFASLLNSTIPPSITNIMQVFNTAAPTQQPPSTVPPGAFSGTTIVEGGGITAVTVVPLTSPAHAPPSAVGVNLDAFLTDVVSDPGELNKKERNVHLFAWIDNGGSRLVLATVVEPENTFLIDEIDDCGGA